MPADISHCCLVSASKVAKQALRSVEFYIMSVRSPKSRVFSKDFRPVQEYHRNLRSLTPLSAYLHTLSSSVTLPVSLNGLHEKRYQAERVRSDLVRDDSTLTGHHRNRPSADIREQRQFKPTTQASTSNPKSAKETLHQQRDGGIRTFSVGNSVDTQFSVTEASSLEPQRPTVDKQSPYEPALRNHDLLGVGSQFFNTGSTRREPRTASTEAAFACPYHGPILRGHPTKPSPGQGLGPMERYLADGASERHVFSHGPDAATRSTRNSCRCLEITQDNIDTVSQVQK